MSNDFIFPNEDEVCKKRKEKDLCLQSCWTCPTHDDSKWNKSHFSRIFRRTTRHRTATLLFRSYIHTLEPVQWLDFMSGIQTKGQHDQSGIKAIFHASSSAQQDNVRASTQLFRSYIHILESVQWLDFMSGIQIKGQLG